MRFEAALAQVLPRDRLPDSHPGHVDDGLEHAQFGWDGHPDLLQPLLTVAVALQ